MAPSMIPAGRSRFFSLMKNRAARLAAVFLVAAGTGGIFLVVQAEDQPTVVVEMDYTKRLKCVDFTNRNSPSPLTLAETYGNVEIPIDLPEGSWEISDSHGCRCKNSPTANCVDLTTIDSYLLYGSDHRPDPGSGKWYAHGLILGTDAYRKGDGTCVGEPGYGLIWVDPDNPNCENNPAVRENFVIFLGSGHKCRPPNPDPQPIWAFRRTVHELAHVLNLHHAQIRNEPVDERGEFLPNGLCKEHMHVHPSGVRRNPGHTYSPEHVMPGCNGDPWCPADPNEDEQAHWRGLHQVIYSPCSRLPDRTGGSLERKANLNIRQPVPEEDSEPNPRGYFFPGELILLDAELRVNQGRLSLPFDPDQMLEPDLGFLTFHIRRKSSPFFGKQETYKGYQRLPSPIYAEPLPSQGRKGRFQLGPGNHICKRNIQLRLPLEEEMVSKGESFELIASFWGFRDGKEPVISKPLLVDVNGQEKAPGLFHEDAFRAFTEPESRRLLYHLGGDHLVKGIRNFETIIKNHPETIYAVYANLVLGVLNARPFIGLNPEGKLIDRDPKPEKAMGFLCDAQLQEELLPIFYRNLLEETLQEVQNNDPESACEKEEEA